MELLESGPMKFLTTEALKYQPVGSSSWTTAATTSRVVGSNYLKTERQKIPNFWDLIRAGKMLPHTEFRQTRWSWGGPDVSAFDGRYEFRDTVPNPDRYYAYTNGWAANLATDGTDAGKAYGAYSDEILDAIVTSRANGAFIALPQAAAAEMAQSGFDATTFMAEILSLRRLLFGTAGRIARVAENIRRQTQGRRKVKVLRPDENWETVLSDAWLAGRYGFRPILYDIRDISRLVDSISGRGERQRLRSSRTGVSVTGEWAEYSEASSSFWTNNIVYRDQMYYDISYRGSVTADIFISSVDNNLAVTGWELIPFSFVVDWFVTVGKALAATEFLLKAGAWTASYGYQLNGTVQRYVNQAPTPRAGVTIEYMYSPSNSASVTRQVRVPTTVSNIPVIRWNVDVLKGLDAAALVRSIFRKRW